MKLLAHSPALVSVADMCSFTPNMRALRSSNKGLLDIPASTLKTKGDRAFAVVAPTLWNKINAESVDGFINLLKTLLFPMQVFT